MAAPCDTRVFPVLLDHGDSLVVATNKNRVVPVICQRRQ